MNEKNIGIIKLYLPLVFNDSMHQSTGYNIETVNFIRLLDSKKIHIISSNDLDNEITKWHDKILVNDYVSSFRDLDMLDEVFVFASKTHTENYESNDTKRLFHNEVDSYLQMLINIKHLVKISYVVTDLALFDNRFADLADTIYCQSSIESLDNDYECKYLPIHENITLHFDKYTNITKDIDLIYIGNDRDRQEKMQHYFKEFDFELYGKFDKRAASKYKVINCVRSLPFNEAQEKLAKSKYTIIITDKSYETTNWLTPRYYEALMNNVIAFIDKDFDKAGHVVSLDDWRRVADLTELQSKIQQLNTDKSLYESILLNQKLELEQVKNNLKNNFSKWLSK